MSLDVAESLARLAGAHPCLGEAAAQLIQEWSPDPPPPTLLSSDLARGLLSRESELADGDLRAVFACVEEILAIGTDQAKDAVATGFLEALVCALDRELSGTERVMRFLGPLARGYCDAWSRWGTVSTP